MTTDDDPRLRNHPLAAQYGVRAFLGVPLRDGDDQPVGSITVLDTAVRCWSDAQMTMLLQLADLLQAVPADAPGPAVVATGAGTAARVTVAGLDSRELLDSVQEAFLAVDAAGVIVGWNPAASVLLGYEADQVCGRRLHECVLPDYDAQPIGAALRRLFADPADRQVFPRVWMRHSAGHRLTMRAAVSVVRATAGPLVCVFLTDLSAQTTAEAEADRHSSFLSALLDSLSVGVIACDADGRVALVNRALREVQHLPRTGRVTTEHVTAAAAMLFDTEGRPMPQDQTPLMRAWRGEHVDDTDVLIRAAGDRVRTFACNARPITGADGRRWGAVVAAHEVTAVRRTERFRACHAAVTRALAEADSASEAAPALLQAVASALGWPHAELWLVDEVTDALVPAGYWSAPGMQLEDLFRPTVTKGEGITGRVWATGEPLWVPDLGDTDHLRTGRARARAEACVRHGIRTVLSVPVHDGDLLLGVLSCYAGAPEHHEDQLTVLLEGVATQIGVFIALRRAEDLARRLDRAKDDFISLVGHEMRTPLTSVSAYAAVLAGDPGVVDDDHRAMLRAIERNASTLRDIIDTLLDLAGLDSGHVGLTITPVDLSRIAADTAQSVGRGAGARTVRVRTDLPDHLIMDGDGHRLRQVVDHLLSNAVAYSRPGDDVHLHLSEHNDVVHLRVTDTGIGIPAGEQEHLFNRFYRARNVRHQGIRGAGLGLSVVQAIVTMHGGTITIGGHQPSGTTVLVRLPRHMRRT